ncbi:MAG: precorrin-6y C5,15-methyltransferase (decarboxylating) subunit CbiE [Candidatus Scalindua sp. AMX11]|nr:MAG: precorrin-6y C5,15-methyltransferase (decarboxylating) subunit CbiE [Candidatus Scalindua sp.]NOG84474.1 precorrin-6y C5,15-methyltransferase (decarboxylating) subunit CbiE [Planctomycetota bacterium]RZV80539.1 MAG: precorrin-6y C5,15-methyltransferase (decarboxylating) subunit CbiE [Candidatus Scalindua sp. SCAELEC01]TDE65313.1 MAG: precorrin-6y C5,15-methyltransferase (decarboxylating) subunit CbiE [Candidatus Scalindua sp. AMX11]
MKRTKTVTIIGMSDDGCLSLTSKAMHAISKGQVLAGGAQHLEFFAEFEGLKIPFQGKLPDVIDRLEELSFENNIVILASGDPMFYGVGGLIVKKFGLDHVDVITHPSSIQIAFSRIGITWHDALIISLQEPSRAGFITKIQASSKVGILTDPEQSPQELAKHMITYNETDWQAWVCENLGGVDERFRCFTIEELSRVDDTAPLNVLILLRKDGDKSLPPTIANLHEDAFAKQIPHKGLITKREIRTLSIVSLGLNRKSVVWDIGTAAGSVAIEAAKIAFDGHVYAVDVASECIKVARENAIRHKVDNIDIVEGLAPVAIMDWPAPDAVFIGGSKGNMREILDVSLEKLTPYGRCVVTAIAVETVQETYQYFKDCGWDTEMIVVNIARSVPLAQYHRYEALSPIHIFTAIKVERN